MKKQSFEELQKSLDILQWERTSQPEKHKTDLDEVASQSLMRAAVLRNLGKFDEARTILVTDILSHQKYEASNGLFSSPTNIPQA